MNLNSDARNAAFVARMRTKSVLNRTIPLVIPLAWQRAEYGLSALAYFRAKFVRLSSLGEYEALNPLLDVLRRGPAKS